MRGHSMWYAAVEHCLGALAELTEPECIERKTLPRPGRYRVV